MKEGVASDQLTILHDRGPSVRSQTVAQLLATLEITKPHSRPHLSDDNPFSESPFKTLKYRPEFPDRFGGFADAHDFCRRFVRWYNHEHHHRDLGLLAPATVHHGQAPALLAAGQHVLDTASPHTPNALSGAGRDPWRCPKKPGSTPRPTNQSPADCLCGLAGRQCSRV